MSQEEKKKQRAEKAAAKKVRAEAAIAKKSETDSGEQSSITTERGKVTIPILFLYFSCLKEFAERLHNPQKGRRGEPPSEICSKET